MTTAATNPWAPLSGTTPLGLERTNEHTCKWPVGDDSPWQFCGQHTTEGKPYCPTHCAIAYRPIDLSIKLRPPKGA